MPDYCEDAPVIRDMEQQIAQSIGEVGERAANFGAILAHLGLVWKLPRPSWNILVGFTDHLEGTLGNVGAVMDPSQVME